MLHLDEPLAKPDQGLLDHLRQVAALGKAIADRLELAEDPRKRALLACWLHDVGKALRSFQVYMQAVRRLEEARSRGAPESEIEDLQRSVRQKKNQAYPHALAALVPTLVLEKQLLGEPFLATAAVVSHHSPLTESLYGHRERSPEDPENLIAFLEKLRPVLAEEGFPLSEETLQLMRRFLKLSPAGLLHDSDLGLKERFQALPRKEFAQVKAVLHLADWLASAGKSPETIFLEAGAQKIRTYIHKQLLEQGHKLHEFQEQSKSLSGRPLALQAPTGTGKTESLLLWAGDADRILYLLPTQATVNAMWNRLRKIYGDDAVGLAHGRAGYVIRKTYEDEDPLDHRLFGSVFAKPVVVATLDQYLIGHLQGRHWEERLTFSQQATVILDEIHAYEPYTLGLLQEALKSFPPKRTAVASATLPSPVLDLLGPMPVVQAEDTLWRRTRHRLILKESPILEGLSEAVEAARSGKRVLIIANTVRTAQTLYQSLKNHGVPPENLQLLHSRFIFRDRMNKENKIADPAPGTILVATQVVEVSLDISYDHLITEIAPLDALVQRMGRVNRKGEHPPVPVVVRTVWDRGSEIIYGKDLLKQSLDLLRDLPSIPSDRDLAQGADALYRAVMTSEEYQKELQEGRENLRTLRDILGCYTLDLADERLRAFFMTRRRGIVSVEVLPAEFEAEAWKMVESGERWKIVELLVPVPAYWVSRYWGQWFHAISDLGVYRTNLPYASETGLHPPGEDTDAPSSFDFL